MTLKGESALETKGALIGKRATKSNYHGATMRHFSAKNAAFEEDYFPRRQLEERAAVFPLQNVILENHAEKTLGSRVT